ncbi:MAG TPA: hypothetical protein DGB85_10510, partial [Deltaproteobacteria bacterium]|nr:hypothetical protein [Deltaproteobacteria bacterium]
MEGADPEGANMEGANLQKIHLEGASIIYLKVNKTLFGGSRLCNTTMPDGR